MHFVCGKLAKKIGEFADLPRRGVSDPLPSRG